MRGQQAFGSAARRVDEARLWAQIMALARIGATDKGGVRRLALGDEEIEARRLLLAWARELDLTVAGDAIGNLFFRMEGGEPEAAPVMTGSHIDSQPSGGKFDGAYGVVAGFEAFSALRECGHAPRRPIEIAVWMNEEGARFAPGMMGSEAFTGRRPLEPMLAVTDTEGCSVAEALARVTAALPALPQRPFGRPVAAFLEAHIEQGPILEACGKPVGIVSGIQGSRRFRITVTGANAHAGTTPRRDRKDALFAALDMIAALRAAFDDAPDLVKFTVGLLNLKPNAPSVVPGEAHFSIDLRHPDWPTLKHLGDQVETLCNARHGPCAVAVREIACAESLEFPQEIQALLRSVSEQLGIAHMDIYSAAGHDARQLHYHCPSGMIFVPCEKGISHNEAEAAQPADLAAGARVLVEALVQLAG